jgi:hypothetical protein
MLEKLSTAPLCLEALLRNFDLLAIFWNDIERAGLGLGLIFVSSSLMVISVLWLWGVNLDHFLLLHFTTKFWLPNAPVVRREYTFTCSDKFSWRWERYIAAEESKFCWLFLCLCKGWVPIRRTIKNEGPFGHTVPIHPCSLMRATKIRTERIRELTSNQQKQAPVQAPAHYHYQLFALYHL